MIPLSQTVKFTPDIFDIAVNSVYDLKLGTPYVIYSSANNGEQDAIYYFPVIQNNQSIMVLSVIDCGEDYSACIEEGIASYLNDINYMNNDNYIFYTDNKNIYAESEDNLKVIDYKCTYEVTNAQIKNSERFENLEFNKKVEEITENYANDNKINSDSQPTMDIVGAQGFETNTNNIVKLKTTNCLVTQGNYNLCWAASVATVVRYRNYSNYSTLTAKQVADKVGIGYNTGANPDQTKNALEKYSISYTNASAGQISYAVYKTNIFSQYPVLIFAYPSSGMGHTVTGIGYTTYGGINQITFYNPATNTTSSVEYKTGGTTFTHNNTKHTWKYTVCAKT